MSKNLFLGLDCSTQSLTALVLDLDEKKILLTKSVNFGKDLPQYNSPSGYLKNDNPQVVHADPLMWLDALDMLFAQLKNEIDLSAIKGISGSGQQHASVYLNKNFFDSNCDSKKSLVENYKNSFSRKTAPIWMDTSTTKQCQEMADALGGAKVFSERTGSAVIERFSGSQIRKFWQEDANAYNDTTRIHLCSSFLCSVLCGKDAAIDFGDGAGMNMLNLKTLSFDEEIMKAIAPDLKEKMPECKASTEIAGKISTYFVEKYNFNNETLINLFTGDNPSSLVGVGAMTQGNATISLGTSDTFFASMPSAKTDPDMYGHVFGNPAGGFMSLICFRNGSLAREALKDSLNVDWGFFENITSSSPVANDGNIMIPFISDEITPRVNSNSFTLSGSQEFLEGKNKTQLVRALIEGQFMNMRLRGLWMGVNPKLIILTGGASKNQGIAKIIADVFNAKVVRLSTSNSAALGAAMRAANAIGKFDWNMLTENFCKTDSSLDISPDENAHKEYLKLSEKFTKVLNEKYFS